uniref:Uncharacterized protein n=1 Tax=Anopheles melas TaxID=34690 RepID=A0A182UK65_9DIPT
MVNNLQIAFERARKKYFDENSSDEELMSHEYPDVSRANAAFKEKPSSKDSNKSTSSDALNGRGQPHSKGTSKDAGKGEAGSKDRSKKGGGSGGNGNNNISAKSSSSSFNANSKDNSDGGGDSPSLQGKDKPCKESKAKSVKSGTSAGGDKKGGKNVAGEKKEPSAPAAGGAGLKKNKANKQQPEVDSEPEPDPEPPEKDKSASRVNNKTVKRKRKEKEKGDKVKSKKLKTETSDHSDGEDGLQRHEDSVNVKSEEELDWCEPERKRYKKDHHGDVEEDEPATTPLQAGDGGGMRLAGGKMDDLKEVQEEEDFPVYESKKKAAVKALQEKEKKKNSSKVKKEEKKVNKPPKGGKGKDAKRESFSPVRQRSMSRTPSPSQENSSPFSKQSPHGSLSPKKKDNASSDAGGGVVEKTGSKKGKDKNGSEADGKQHKKGSNAAKSGAGISVAKLDKKTKKSGALASASKGGGKGRQKKAGGKQKSSPVELVDEGSECEEEADHNARHEPGPMDTNGERNDEASDMSDFEDIDNMRVKPHDTSIEEEEDGGGGEREPAAKKSSDKSKNKKDKTSKKNVGKAGGAGGEHHRAKKSGGSKSKQKGKDRKMDKKSHKRDKAGKGKKKSKSSSDDRAHGDDREATSSGGEDEEGADGGEGRVEYLEDASKSASKPVQKQSRDSRLAAATRSMSRSPSPARSYCSDGRSARDSGEEEDDQPKQAHDSTLPPNRSITPDIKDKFDLIKERRNRAAAAAAAAAESKAKAKQAKAKGKEAGSSGKKGKSSTKGGGGGNRGQKHAVEEDSSVNASASPSSAGAKQQQKKHQHVCDPEDGSKPSSESKSSSKGTASGGGSKGKKNRDKSTANGGESSNAKPGDKKHPRPGAASTDSTKKVDRSNEYDFVDDGPDTKLDKNHAKSAHAASGGSSKAGKKSTSATATAAGPTGSTVQRHPKANSKTIPPPTGKMSKTPATAAGGGGGGSAAGANMEELELETEQTLKDINKWLENTPRFPEYSSASNSPSRYIMDDFDTVPVKIEPADFRKPIPLSQLPAANEATASPLRGASPGLATIAAPPKAFSPRSAASSKEPSGTAAGAGKQASGSTTPSASHAKDASKGEPAGSDSAGALKDSTNSTAAATGSKPAGPTSHTLLGPPPIIPPHSQKKEPKEPKRKSLKEKLCQLGAGGRKRDLHHHRTTIDRLQPGKAKGNLIGTIQNLNKPDELFPLGAGGGAGAGGSGAAGSGALNKVKEVKNSLIVKTDESKPKLSLGTVLNTEGFGIVQQHNFADDEDDPKRSSSLLKKDEDAEEDELLLGSSTIGAVKPLISALKTAALAITGGSSPASSREGGSLAKKDEPSNTKAASEKTEPASDLAVAGEPKSSTVSSAADKLFSLEDGKPGKAEEAAGKDALKGKDKPSATPNLNAWIKAFGAPKKPKKSDDTDEPGKASPASDKSKPNENTSTHPSSNESSSGIGSLPTIPGSLESPSYPTLPTVPRQRKASTGSTVSERSSYSQDPDSPRIGIDERLGAYPAPYPSPIGASPIMTSPKLDDTQKSPYHPLNGAIKVGFYQDTTQKSSPEKSCSPRDLPSPYPQYSQHLYTSNAANATGTGGTTTTAGNNIAPGGGSSVYGSYSAYGTTPAGIGSTGTNVNQPSTAAAAATAGSVADSFKGYGKELKSPVDFYDQYKQPASQESDYNSSMSPSTNPNSPYHNPASSPYQQQPNSPSCYQQQQQQQQQQQPPQASSSSPYGHQPSSIASPASSVGPLSPYNAPAVPHSPATGQTTPSSVSGHSPYNPGQGQSPYHTNQAPSTASTSPSTGSAVGGAAASGGQPKLQSKPNTPLHQSPNSPFSQSNQSSPYSQQDPNSPYSSQGGQLSPFQPMSPKPQQPAAPSAAGNTSNSNANNAIKLAPPIITPQQAAAAAGVILPPESPAHSQATTAATIGVHQAQNLTGSGGSTGAGNNSSAPSSTPGTTIASTPMQLNSHQSPWTAHHNQYNPYLNHPGDTAGGAGSIKSKAFDMFNRAATMNFPRGFGAPGIHQPAPAGNVGANSTGGYDHHRSLSQAANMNKAHDMSGGGAGSAAASVSAAPTGYTMQPAGGKPANQHPADQLHLPRYDQRSPQHLQQQQQQQQHGASSASSGPSSQPSGSGNASADLSSAGGGYKSYGVPAPPASSASASLMDPAIRNLTSLSSLYNPDPDRLLGGPGAPSATTAGGFYDKGMPSTAHMFGKNLSQPPVASSSAATTSALQQMFNNTMAATTMAAYNANREQPNVGSYVPSPNYHHPQQHQQRTDMMNAANIQPQKMSHNANVPSATGGGAGNASVSSEPAPPPAKPKRSRKKKDQLAQDQAAAAAAAAVAAAAAAQQQQQTLHQHAMHAAHQQQALGPHQGFPAYPGLKPSNSTSSGSGGAGGAGGGPPGMGSASAAPGAVGNPASSAETSAISLKTANIVPGSAFNFGPGPAGLGLPPGGLYGDTSASTYLEESYRNSQNPYYLPPSHRGTSATGSGGTGTEADKLGNPIGSQATPPGSVAAAAAAAAVASVHGPPPPTAASPYHQFLASHHGTRPYQFMNQFDPLHQQYLRQEELRAQMMINQGLLGAPGAAPPGAYGQPGYHHPAIGMHKPYDAMNSMNRSPFL